MRPWHAMSRNALSDLSQYQDVANQLGGQIAAIGMKARRVQPQGLAPRKPAAAQPVVNLDPQAAQRAQYNAEMRKMFTPVEQGGALITTATPVALVGGSLPEGHSWANVPQAMRDKTVGLLPDGVKPIGFHPGHMSDMQFNALAYFNQQRDAERQDDADRQQTIAAQPAK